MATLEIIFWIAAIIVGYTYIGYGVLLWGLVKMKRFISGKTINRLPANEELPDVTFLVCAFNEQDVVEMKMDNTRSLDYPKEKLHIMWVTDGSTDKTNEYLKKFKEVEIVFSPERRGKTAALNHGISLVKTPFTIMTDANTIVNKEAIKEIIRCFQDPKVGCVAGEKRVIARENAMTASQGEGLYWRYESKLKQMDSELYSAMGAAGELNAIRTSLYRPMPENALLDDFVMSMLMVDEGYRIAYTPNAYAMEYGSANLEEESKRKRRIAAGGLQSCWWLKRMMNPFRQPIVAFQFVSHRVLRWTITPLALFSMIPINTILVFMNAGNIYTITWLTQLLFYTSAFIGYVMEQHGRKIKHFYIPYYFLFMNINIFHGIGYLRTHRHGGIWEKAQRA